MILSDSFRALLQEIDTPLTRAVLRRERYYKSFKRYAMHFDVWPVSIGFKLDYLMKSQTEYWNKRLRRYAPKREIGSYFTFRERDGLVSYCPKGKEQRILENGHWAREGRQEIKPGKWIKAVLPEKVIRRLGGDPAVAQFAARFDACERGEGFTFSPAASFRDIYSPTFFGCDDKDDAESKIAPSCMWGKHVGSFYNNVGSVTPYVIYLHGRPVGRFLFWPSVSKGEHEISLVDRVYAKPSATEAVFRWAAKNGYFRKEKQAVGCRTAVGPNGDDMNLSGYGVDIKTPFIPSECFSPYVDTFQNGEPDEDGELVRLYCGSGKEKHFSFSCTDGSYEGGPDSHEGEVQDVDGEWIDEDEAIMIRGNYYHQDDERIVYCDHGSHEGDHILREDAYAVELGGRLGTVYVHEDDVSRA